MATKARGLFCCCCCFSDDPGVKIARTYFQYNTEICSGTAPLTTKPLSLPLDVISVVMANRFLIKESICFTGARPHTFLATQITAWEQGGQTDRHVIKGTFFWAYSGIGIVGIKQTIVCSQATLIPEWL